MNICKTKNSFWKQIFYDKYSFRVKFLHISKLLPPYICNWTKQIQFAVWIILSSSCFNEAFLNMRIMVSI